MYMAKNPSEDTLVRFYTDGAASLNGRAGCTAAYGVYAPELEPSNYQGRVRTNPSNQRAELIAIQRALELMNTACLNGALIVSDSMYAIQCLTKWYTGWEEKGWKTAKGTAVKHAELIKDCLRLTTGKVVRYQHVRSHLPEPSRTSPSWQDWYGNREADRLAGVALRGPPAPTVQERHDR